MSHGLQPELQVREKRTECTTSHGKGSCQAPTVSPRLPFSRWSPWDGAGDAMTACSSSHSSLLGLSTRLPAQGEENYSSLSRVCSGPRSPPPRVLRDSAYVQEMGRVVLGTEAAKRPPPKRGAGWHGKRGWETTRVLKVGIRNLPLVQAELGSAWIPSLAVPLNSGACSWDS